MPNSEKGTVSPSLYKPSVSFVATVSIAPNSYHIFSSSWTLYIILLPRTHLSRHFSLPLTSTLACYPTFTQKEKCGFTNADLHLSFSEDVDLWSPRDTGLRLFFTLFCTISRLLSFHLFRTLVTLSLRAYWTRLASCGQPLTFTIVLSLCHLILRFCPINYRSCYPFLYFLFCQYGS
jgi:hypothetical protein